MKKLLFLIACLLSFNSAYAFDWFSLGDDCSDMRLDSKGGSMENVPAIDQASFGDCYAVVASEMVDAYRFSHGDKRTNLHSAPLMTAIQIGTILGWKEINGYNSCNAVTVMRNQGACDSAAVREKNGQNPEAYLASYAALQSSLSSMSNNKTSTADQIERVAKNDAVAVCEELANSGMARGAITVGDVETSLLKDGSIPMMEEIRKTACQGPATFKVDVPACQQFSSKGPEPITVDRTIQWRLNQDNPQPVGISFCSTMLFLGKNFQGNLAGVVRGDPTAAHQCSPHEAMVIGRRRNPTTGSCQYLVRNSWGKECNYSKDWTCDGKGDLWMDNDALSRNIYRISFM